MLKLPDSLAVAFALVLFGGLGCVFGPILLRAGYVTVQRGSFSITSRDVAQVISPRSDPAVFWIVAGGMLTIGAVATLVAALCMAYAARILVRSWRATRDI